MRFLSDGPIIPQSLLELRDNGEVVFFCGAGVSIPAGFPSFLRLTELIIQDLDTASDGRERRLLDKIKAALSENDFDAAPAIDQLVGALQREYGVLQVEALVAKHLRVKRGASRRNHETILKLATDSREVSRLVTTNFDTMFEATQPNIRWSAPPIFPSLTEDDPLEGLVYLHGRLPRLRISAPPKAQGLVLGSADFGRAYLADGRTLRFVSQLLKRYVVVFLGYSADDPPIRYLLEGLRSLGEGATRELYAFVDLDRSGMSQRWRDRGVEPISYAKGGSDHSGLWKSLEAWAVRATSPGAWREQVLQSAMQGPSALAPHERGQVVSIIRSSEGAHAFADMLPTLSAEWLCVFDPLIRYAKPAPEFDLEKVSETFDPLRAYGLDDDPLRPADQLRHIPDGAIDVLSTLTEDKAAPSPTRVTSNVNNPYSVLQPRLVDLGRWLAKISNDPVTAWWAAHYHSLHPLIGSWIESAPTLKAVGRTEVARFWRLYLEEGRRPERQYDFDLYEFFQKAKDDGWSRIRLREFRQIIQPQLVFQRPWRTPKPPVGSADKMPLSQIAQIKVRFPSLPESRPIPDAVLGEIVRSVALALEHGSSLLTDADERWHQSPSLFPAASKTEVHRDDEDAMFLWFAELFSRLTKIDPAKAVKELMQWPDNQRFFFLKLRIWAWSNKRLVDHGAVAAAMLAMDLSLFWENDVRRELLFTLRARWSEFKPKVRSAIEAKLLQGPPRWHREKNAKHAVRAAITSAGILGWLQLHRRKLSTKTRQSLQALRKANANWKPSWSRNAADSGETTGGWVGSNTDSTSLESASLSDVIRLAGANTRHDWAASIDYDPFRGLVANKPVRALSALAYGGRKKSFPVAFWRDLLTYWPATAPVRATGLLALRIAALPDSVLSGLAQPASWWLRDNAKRLHHYRSNLIWAPWDRVLAQIRILGATATTSGITKSHNSGTKAERRMTLAHALNGVVGALSDAILNALSAAKPKRGQRLNVEFSGRMAALLETPGEGAAHAASVYCRSLHWLFWVDPNWSRTHLIPMFELESRLTEAAWNGYAYNNQLPERNLFELLKKNLLAAIAGAEKLAWEQSCLDKLVQYLIVGAVFFQGRRQLVRSTEARDCLRRTNDFGRGAAVRYMRQHVKDGKSWGKFGSRFVQDVWPRELSVRSHQTSRLLAEMATHAEEQAQNAVRIVLPLLGQGDHLDMFLHQICPPDDRNGTSFAVRFPIEAMELVDRLLGPAPSSAPYGFERFLQVIERASAQVSESSTFRRFREFAAVR